MLAERINLALSRLKQGFHSIERLACNLEDLRRLVRELTGKGVRIQFLK